MARRALEVGRRFELEVEPGEIVGDPLLVHRQRGGARGVVVPEGIRLGENLVLEARLVALVGFPAAMRGLLMQHQKKRPVLGPGLEPLEAEVGGEVGAMSLDGELATAGNQKGGIPILTLAGKHDPAIEAGGVGTQVPFADHAGVVAAGLQMLGDRVA